MSPLACLDPRPLWVLSVMFRRLNGQCLTSESKNACCEACSAASRAMSRSVCSELSELSEPWLGQASCESSVNHDYRVAIKEIPTRRFSLTSLFAVAFEPDASAPFRAAYKLVVSG